MSAAPTSPILIRRVINSGIMFENEHHADEALARYEGSDVLLDMEIDVDREMRCFRVYDTWENEICLLDIGEVNSLAEVV